MLTTWALLLQGSAQTLLATRNPDDAEVRELLVKVQQDIKQR